MPAFLVRSGIRLWYPREISGSVCSDVLRQLDVVIQRLDQYDLHVDASELRRLVFSFPCLFLSWSGRQFSIVCDLPGGNQDALPLSYARIVSPSLQVQVLICQQS